MISLQTIIYHAPHADITLLLAGLLCFPVVLIACGIFAAAKILDQLSK